MANRLQKLQKLVYVPAVPAIQAQAAYCVTKMVDQSYSGLQAGQPSSPPAQPSVYLWRVSVDDGSYDAAYGGLPAGYSGVKSSSSYSPYAPAQVPVKTCYPAIMGRAGAPARTDAFDNFGWNAGARSITPIPDSGFVTAVLPPSPFGVQLGLIGRSPSYYYSEMAHSLVVRHDALTIVEYGTVVAGPFVVPASVSVRIQRSAGEVSYWAAGAKLYTSSEASAGEAYAGAVLYSVLDYADNPVIGEVIAPISFTVAMPSLVSAIGEVDYNAALTVLPALQLTAVLEAVQGLIKCGVELQGLALAVSESALAQWVNSTMPALSLRAELVNAEVIPDNFTGLTAPLTLTASLRDGGAIYFSADINLAFAVSETSSIMTVNAILPVVPQLIAVSPYLPADTAEGSDAAVLADWGSLESALLLIAIDSLDIGSSASLVMVLELAGMDSLSIGEHASFGSIITLLAMEQVAVMSHASSARQQALQYAVNYMTGALTTYHDFDFAGFTSNAGRAFAWNASGLYRLGVERDSGEVISALVDFGATDYGDSHIKHAELAFVGVRTDGECYLRLTADDEAERVYSLVGGGNLKRAQLAKGVTSRYWNVRLELTDASFVTIDSVELEVGVTQRRSFNRRS